MADKDTGQFEQKVQKVAEESRAALRDMLDETKSKYWELHAEVGTTPFNYSDTQRKALAKLGQYAIAMQALSAAYTAFTRTTCNGHD